MVCHGYWDSDDFQSSTNADRPKERRGKGKPKGPTKAKPQKKVKRVPNRKLLEEFQCRRIKNNKWWPCVVGAPCRCSMPAPNLEEWTTFIKLMEMKVLEAQKKQQDLQQELLEGCDVEEFDSTISAAVEKQGATGGDGDDIGGLNDLVCLPGYLVNDLGQRVTLNDLGQPVVPSSQDAAPDMSELINLIYGNPWSANGINNAVSSSSFSSSSQIEEVTGLTDESTGVPN